MSLSMTKCDEISIIAKEEKTSLHLSITKASMGNSNKSELYLPWRLQLLLKSLSRQSDIQYMKGHEVGNKG